MSRKDGHRHPEPPEVGSHSVSNEHLERMLNRVHEWTRSADSKVGVLASAEVALLAYILPKIEKWWIAQTPQPILTYPILLFSSALMLTGAGLALIALFPNDRNPSRLASVTFFGDISKMQLDAYRRKLDGMDVDDVRADYVSQIHVSSGIATRKHRLLKFSSGFFAGGIALLGLLRFAVSIQRW